MLVAVWVNKGCVGVEYQLTSASFPLPGASANKHKPWIEAEYQGIVMENDNTVLLNPPLFALDKDAPLRYAGNWGRDMARWVGQRAREERGGPGRESNEEMGKRPWENGRSRLKEANGLH